MLHTYNNFLHCQDLILPRLRLMITAKCEGQIIHFCFTEYKHDVVWPIHVDVEDAYVCKNWWSSPDIEHDEIYSVFQQLQWLSLFMKIHFCILVMIHPFNSMQLYLRMVWGDRKYVIFVSHRTVFFSSFFHSFRFFSFLSNSRFLRFIWFFHSLINLLFDAHSFFFIRIQIYCNR